MSDDDILTEEAKSAIRSYMLRLITLPGVLLTIVTFLIGFFVNEAARGSAYQVAYTNALGNVSGLVQRMAAEVAEAERASADAEELKSRLEVLVKEAQESDVRVLRLLLEDRDFRKSVDDALRNDRKASMTVLETDLKTAMELAQKADNWIGRNDRRLQGVYDYVDTARGVKKSVLRE